MKTNIILLALSIGCTASRVFATDALPEGRPVKIILIGDSTMTDSAGWGLGFKQFVNDKAEVVNLSRGGRSSMSFMKEGRWTNALAMKGDYYLIQFGHNNEPGKPGRSTDMPTFIANMKQYVDDAKAIGAKPILLTPLVRRQWDKDDPAKIKSSLTPYAVEVRKIATEENVPLVELHDLSKALCESLGREKCYEFSPTKVVDGTNVVYDGTHLKPNGSVMMAQIIVGELRKKMPELAPVFRDEPLSTNPVSSDAKYDAVVSFDGSGTHTNVQEAINAAPDDGTKPFVILVKPGVYDGPFIVPKAKRFIRLTGEERDNTILTYDKNVNEHPSGRADHVRSYPFNPGTAVAAGDFQAENLTFQNTSGDHGQALALRVDGDRAVFNNCKILGWQDTLMINNGRQYFTNCFIAGRVDFIYGSATAVFDHCEIQSRNGGHVTAASTPRDHPYGFVFLDCKLTGDPRPWVNTNGTPANTNSAPMADLGRPWRPFASVTYLDCEMDNHIKPVGWNNWRNPTNELTARYAEYHSTGPGAKPDERVKWARQLSDDEAKNYTVANVLGGEDNWKPVLDQNGLK